MSSVIQALLLRKRAARAEAQRLAAERDRIIAEAKGERGERGPMPDHEWKGTRLRFEKPDGTWGEYVDLKGKDGKPGGHGAPGPRGKDATGGGGASAGVLYFSGAEAADHDGNVGRREYAPGTVPADKILTSCVTDSEAVIVSLVVAGTAEDITPTVTVDGIPATLAATSAPLIYIATAAVQIEPGVTTITAQASTGVVAALEVTRAVGGPAVTSATFGRFPGAQTALKAGDAVTVFVQAPADAVEVNILAGGASGAEIVAPVVDGMAAVPITISSASGNQPVSLLVRNALGTWGEVFVTAPLPLDQTEPVIGEMTVGYPPGKQAFGEGDAGTLSAAVTGAEVVAYTSPHFSIAAPGAYAETKPITNTNAGYVAAGTNLTITASRPSNGSTATRSVLARIATAAPSASISIAGNPPRLSSSPAGIDYEVRITPDQMLSGPPSLAASHGEWQGAGWVLAGTYWRRSLRITDAVPRGAAMFSGLSVAGLSNLTGSTITAGAGYIVGGLSSRTLVFAAFARVAAIGAQVGNEAKTSAQLTGGATLTRYSDSTSRLQGYYIANADGTYNPTGAYLALSDADFAGSNTSGTLSVAFAEAP